jgi:ribose 5-phosphate isomerase B
MVKRMKVAIGSDHRGYAVKPKVVELVHRLGHIVQDLGTTTDDAVDYPDYAYAVGQAIARSEFDCGILICGTGVGMVIAANKVRGVRAALCHDTITAEMSRRHLDANVLCISADLLGEVSIEQMVKTWLSTKCEGGRHARRVEKIKRIENQQNSPVALNGYRSPLQTSAEHVLDGSVAELGIGSNQELCKELSAVS